MAPSPAGRRRARRHFPGPIAGLAASLAALALVVTGCGIVSSSAPPATPTNFPGITGRLAAAGFSVSDYVSGDAGCTDQDLVPASISLHLAGLDQATPLKLYLYVFKDRPAWERHRAQIGPCAQAYVTDPQTFGEIEQSPYVLAGQGPWPPKFEAALRQVMELAAGTGG
jgi:hypothetical protein